MVNKQLHEEYHVWADMKSRCYNPNTSNFAAYGGFGIQICDAWRTSFDRFLKDMGPRPKGDYHIHRINSEGDYEPNNCIWILAQEHCKLPKRYVPRENQFPPRQYHPRDYRVSNKPLTVRQQEVLIFMAESSIIPTYREIADHFGITVKGAYDHVTALIRKGVIKRTRYRARSIVFI